MNNNVNTKTPDLHLSNMILIAALRTLSGAEGGCHSKQRQVSETDTVGAPLKMVTTSE